MTKLRTIVTATLIATIIPFAATAGNLKAPTEAKFKPTKAQLAIKSPITNTCPTTAKMSGWIFTNKPGKVSYMIARKGGSVGGPYILDAKKGANGISMASFSRTLQIHQKIDAQYRILVPAGGSPVLSNWVPLKASCKIMLGG